MSHNDLGNYYNSLFTMVHHYKWDAEYLENITPFERDFHFQLLKDFQKEQEKQLRKKNG